MGKGAKKATILIRNSQASGKDGPTGCNCPTGCLKQEPIVESETAPEGAVLMECSSSKCSVNKYMHEQCFSQFQREMVKIIQSSAYRTRDWSDEMCHRNMWTRGYDLIFKYCRCKCGGSLKESIKELNAKRNEDEHKKKKTKPNKNLPALVVDASGTGVSNAHKKQPKFKTSTFATYGPSQPYSEPVVNSLVDDDGACEYPVGMHRPSTPVKEQKKQPTKKQLVTIVPSPTKDAKLKGPRPVYEPLIDHCEFSMPQAILLWADVELYWRRIATALQ